MTPCKPWAGIALIGLTALAGPAFAHKTEQSATASAIGKQVAVQAAPVKPVPDVAEAFDADAGLEAREAFGAEVSSAQASSAQASSSQASSAAVVDPTAPAIATLNAQYALLRASAAPKRAVPTDTQPTSVALARAAVESAQGFADYMQRASAMRPDYVDAAGVSRALRAGGVYEAGQLQEGAVAYVALAALQDRAFVAAVGELGRDPQVRPALVLKLAADPRAVLQTRGADAAALRAAAALGRLGGSLYGSGAAVKQSAYDIQHSAWSKVSVVEPEATLAEIKTRSTVREALAADRGQAMIASLVRLRQGGGADGSGKLTPVVARGLTLAALAVLGEAGEEHADRVQALLTEASSAQCLKMARLNLYQCLSVAGPNYEDVFCLGQHAMMETARCVADASGWSPSAVEPARPVEAPVVQAASIMVPVAFTPGEPVAGPAALEPTVVEPTPSVAPAPVGIPTTATTLQMASAGMG
ncbi:hypothetical protein [Caulobacter sp. S45]|uniref:hypothetical protein n=1 Tax=Caulobacter sp. S45 TaxID=1641861 RepID=UPI001576B0F2|nr:hypothetical protein [Caulobacter sp. S45]